MKLSPLIIIFLSFTIYSDITNTCEKELKNRIKSLPFNSILREDQRDFYMMSEDLTQQWDTVNNAWKNHKLTKSEYDSVGTIKKRIYISWDTSNVMEGFGFQYSITYDENFKFIEVITQDSTSESNQWINTEKFSLTYNDMDSLTKTVFQIWDTVTNQWKNYCIDSSTYDAEGNKIEDLFQGWIGQDTLMFMLRTFYTYNQSGKIIESYSQEWQAYIDSIWHNKSKSIYKYDENDNLIERIGQEWRVNAWANYFRNLYTVDSSQITTTRGGGLIFCGWKPLKNKITTVPE